MEKLKVLIYFEGENIIKKSGIGRAMRHQMEALTSAEVNFTTNKKDTFNLAHINTYGFNSKRLLRKCKRKNIPVIVHGHSTFEDFRNSYRAWQFLALFYNSWLKYMYSRADLIITPTLYSENLIKSYGYNVPVTNLSNGLNVEEYKPSEDKVKQFKEHFKITDEKVIIGIGFLFERKGIRDFIEVARAFPDIKFIWFGHLPWILRQSKVNKAIRRKPNNVILPGYIANDIIKGAMQYAEMLFFPSNEETEGIVVLEGLASKIPVLIRDIGVYEDWLKDGKNAYKARNNQEFIEKIKYIIHNDNSQVIKNGYQTAKDRDLTIIGQRLKKIYEGVQKKDVK